MRDTQKGKLDVLGSPGNHPGACNLPFRMTLLKYDEYKGQVKSISCGVPFKINVFACGNLH